MNEKPLKVNAYSCYMFCHGFLIQSRVHKVERFHDVWFAILFTLATLSLFICTLQQSPTYLKYNYPAL